MIARLDRSPRGRRPRRRKSRSQRLDALLAKCESPIEIRLVSALFGSLRHIRLDTQAPIGPYRADILAESGALRLVIEADGAEFHGSAEQQEYDQRRDEYMASKGYRVQRFTGSQINRDVRACAEAIAAILADAPPAPPRMPTPTRTERRAATRKNRALRAARELRTMNRAALTESNPMEITPAPLPRTSTALW